MEEKEIFEKLLNDFSLIHIPKEEKTFMGICQYPGSRFEEVCSRILAFYFNPNEEHGLRDLWFRALNQCKCMKQEGEYSKPQKIDFVLEEHTYSVEGYENKRIDIVIEADNTVYAIENKIGAQLYNDLSIYSKHIEEKYKSYPKKEKIILTAHLLNSNEIEKAKKNGFKEISYKTLFEQVNDILGDYIADSNVKHLTFMIDFMKTLNDKMNFMENKERAEFFSKHKDSVDKLIEQHKKWREEVFRLQSERISHLHAELNNTINDDGKKWWIWSGFSVGVSFNDNTDKKIGIEAWFEEAEGNACAKFKIYITTWGNKQQSDTSWNFYKEEVMNEFKEGFVWKNNNNERVYWCIFDKKVEPDMDIIENLIKCYKFLTALAKKKIEEKQNN